jgi:hypothetical protein
VSSSGPSVPHWTFVFAPPKSHLVERRQHAIEHAKLRHELRALCCQPIHALEPLGLRPECKRADASVGRVARLKVPPCDLVREGWRSNALHTGALIATFRCAAPAGGATGRRWKGVRGHPLGRVTANGSRFRPLDPVREAGNRADDALMHP